MFRKVRQWFARFCARLAGEGAQNGVFISYRRSDSADVAGRLYDALQRDFSKQVLFFDVDTLPKGVHYPNKIDTTIRSARVVLVLIGESWHTCTDAEGTLRLHDPTDFVRHEVELAHVEKKPIVPVLIGTAKLQQNDPRLPESLRFIGEINGMLLRHGADFHRDVADLVVALKSLDVPVSWGHWGRRNKARLAATLLCAGLTLAALPLLPRAVQDPSHHFGHLSADDRERLRGADETTVVRLAGMCESERIRQLADEHENDPKTLLRILKEFNP